MNEEEQVKEKKPKDNHVKYLAIGGTILMVLLILFSMIPRSSINEQKTTPFTQCLLDKGIKMYGAYWCSHCSAQKAIFGDMWASFAAAGGYIECDAKGPNGNPDLCKARNVEGYPTWQIPMANNTIGVVQGAQDLDAMANISGCPLGG